MPSLLFFFAFFIFDFILYVSERNWTGLLVEPNKKAFNELLQKRRKSHSIHACLSIAKFPKEMIFDSADVFGGVIGGDLTQEIVALRNSVGGDMRSFDRVQCLPVYSMLLALGNPVVDYFR